MIIEQYSLDSEHAATLCKTANQYASDHNLRICCWVLDPHGNPLAMQRHNQAALASTEIARKKAWTAVSFKIPTDQWEQRLKKQPHLLNNLMNQDGIAMFGGGFPIFHNDQLIGAIGVSGASEQQDMDCAQHALNTIVLS